MSLGYIPQSRVADHRIIHTHTHTTCVYMHVFVLHVYIVCSSVWTKCCQVTLQHGCTSSHSCWQEESCSLLVHMGCVDFQNHSLLKVCSSREIGFYWRLQRSVVSRGPGWGAKRKWFLLWLPTHSRRRMVVGVKWGVGGRPWKALNGELGVRRGMIQVRRRDPPCSAGRLGRPA